MQVIDKFTIEIQVIKNLTIKNASHRKIYNNNRNNNNNR